MCNNTTMLLIIRTKNYGTTLLINIVNISFKFNIIKLSDPAPARTNCLVMQTGFLHLSGHCPSVSLLLSCF
jgi:hypothetical protein